MKNLFLEVNYKLSTNEINTLRAQISKNKEQLNLPGRKSVLQHCAFNISDEDFNHYPFFSWLKTTYNFTTDLISFDANSFYKWHVDNNHPNRLTVLNIELFDYSNTLTVVKEFTGLGNEIHESGNVYRVPYKFGYPMLLNTSHPHSIFNFEQQSRYLLSLGLGRPMDDIISDFKLQGYI